MGLKFNCIDDIPEFPEYKSQEEFQKLVKDYLEAGAIAKKDLVPGGWYIGQSRTTNIAQWWPRSGFEFIRHKFTGRYIDDIDHFEDADENYDVFVPFKLIFES